MEQIITSLSPYVYRMLLTLPHLAVSVYCNGTVSIRPSVRPSVCLSRRLDSNSSAQLVSGSRIMTRDLAERSPQSAAPMAGGDILRAGVNRVPPITPIGEGVGE